MDHGVEMNHAPHKIIGSSIRALGLTALPWLGRDSIRRIRISRCGALTLRGGIEWVEALSPPTGET